MKRTAVACLLVASGVLTGSLGLVAAPQSGSPVNTLSAAEKAAGWTLLFDGKTTAGWRAYKGTEIPAGWTVSDGALTRTAKASDIVSLDQYGDFELAFEWKVEAASNSGVFIRATEEYPVIWNSAPEYQILDNAGHADGKKPETSAGACYALYAPAKDVTKTPGEWNQSRIVAKGTKVQHWLNGTKLLEYDTSTTEWAEKVAASKFAKFPNFAKAARGFVGLQDHGDKVAFRSIKIRTL